MRISLLLAILAILLICLTLTFCLSFIIAADRLDLFDEGPSRPLPSPTPVPGASPTPLALSCPSRISAEPSALPDIGQETLDLLLSTVIPPRDPRQIATRLGRTQGVVPEVVREEPFDYQAGDIEKFWVQDEELSDSYFQIDAHLAYMSEYAYWWVQEGIEFDQEDLGQAAEEFDNHIYPTVREFFGQEWSPGVDADARIHVLNAELPSVGGYYSSSDEYPSAVKPYSNQREMIYMSITNIPPSSPVYLSVLAHEFQHMVHWNVDPNDDTWINEGSGELASFLSGYSPAVFSFPREPDTPIMAWTDEIGESGSYYEGAFLFSAYFTQRFGADIVREFTAEDADGIAGFDATLQSRDLPLTFEDVFKDWLVANYLDDPDLEGGCFGYRSLDMSINRVTRVRETPFSLQETVNQYAADYYEFRDLSGDLVVRFDGDEIARVTASGPKSGNYAFWSNRGDVSDMTLTRAFDLRGVNQATLTSWMWWDIEDNYDYAYIEVSTDGGQTWEILEGQFTTAENPYGSNEDVGWTGKSGGGLEPEWVQEEIALTPYAGREILLRFEYITDDAFNRPGLLIDDVTIPETGYFEGFEESEGSWEVAGFIRTDTFLPQRWAVQVIEFLDQGPVIREMTLDAAGQGELVLEGLGNEVERAVLIISALAPAPNYPAQYQFTVEAP